MLLLKYINKINLTNIIKTSFSFINYLYAILVF